jgi:hypothetical protein
MSLQKGVPWELLRARLVNRLRANLMLADEVARWAVETWAVASGTISAPEHYPAEVRSEVTSERALEEAGASAATEQDFPQEMLETEFVQGGSDASADFDLDELYDFLFGDLGLDADDADRLVSNVKERVGSLRLPDVKAFLDSFQQLCSWYRGEVGDDALEAIEFATEMINSLDREQFEYLKQLYSWYMEEVDSDTAEAMDFAKDAAARIGDVKFKMLKRYFSKAVDEFDKDPDEAVAYARRRAGL